jgi:hypothetical protein
MWQKKNKRKKNSTVGRTEKEYTTSQFLLLNHNIFGAPQSGCK